MCNCPPSRLILREQPAADMPAAVVGSKGLGTQPETQPETKTVESQSKRGAILASRVSPVRDARFIRRGMKKVFSLWLAEPIFLCFPHLMAEMTRLIPLKPCLGRVSFRGRSKPLEGVPPKSLVIVGALHGRTVSFRCRERGWRGRQSADSSGMGGRRRGPPQT